MQTELNKKLNGISKKEERRNFFRVDLIKRVRYKISGPPSIECFTQNISEGGLCLLMGEELFPGMTVRTEFALPGKEPKLVTTDAVVVWQKGYLTGVKFIT
jgi:c-di-GMP-binding flagellar brake protein YcgR